MAFYKNKFSLPAELRDAPQERFNVAGFIACRNDDGNRGGCPQIAFVSGRIGPFDGYECFWWTCLPNFYAAGSANPSTVMSGLIQDLLWQAYFDTCHRTITEYPPAVIRCNPMVLTTSECCPLWVSQGGKRSLIKSPQTHLTQKFACLKNYLTIKYHTKNIIYHRCHMYVKMHNVTINVKALTNYVRELARCRVIERHSWARRRELCNKYEVMNVN